MTSEKNLSTSSALAKGTENLGDNATVTGGNDWVKAINARPQLVFLALGLVIVAKAAIQLSTIDLLVAVRAVSSPLAFFWQSADPQLAEINWPAGSLDFRFSSLMNALLALWNTGLLGEKQLLWFHGFVSIALQLSGVAYLSWVLFKDATIAFVTTCVFAVSPIAGVNFGNFGAGNGLQMPVLFYSFADGFGFFALALIIRERFILGAIALAAAMNSHVVLGAYMGIFAFFFVAAKPSNFLKIRVWLAGVLCLVLVSPVLLRIVGGSTVGVGAINLEDWVLMSKMANFHWHPISFGLFDKIGHVVLIPFSLLMLGWWMVQPSLPERFLPIQQRLLVGCAAVAVLSALGILLSDVWSVPVVMKAAPMRASMLISLTALFTIIAGLVFTVRRQQLLPAALSVYVLVGLFIASAGLALLPLLLLGAYLHKNTAVRYGLVAAALGLLLFMYLQNSYPQLQSTVAGYWAPLGFFKPGYVIDFSIAGGILRASWGLWLAFLVALATGFIALGNRRNAMLAVMLIAAIGTLTLTVDNRSRWLAGSGDNARSFLAAQMWARENTPPHAIFMGDPSRENGWREFSRRAWFGSIRELSHFATLYDSSAERFEKGIARVKVFGLDPRDVDRDAVRRYRGGKYMISVLNPIYKKGYLNLSADDFRKIRNQFGVSYVVAKKTELPKGVQSLKLAYENDRYAIFEIAP